MARLDTGIFPKGPPTSDLNPRKIFYVNKIFDEIIHHFYLYKIKLIVIKSMNLRLGGQLIQTGPCERTV